MIELSGERLRVVGPMVIASATELKNAGEAALASGAISKMLALCTPGAWPAGAGVAGAATDGMAGAFSWAQLAPHRPSTSTAAADR